MKLTITSDGSPRGTRVVDAETGKDLSGQISSVQFIHEASKQPVLTLELINVEVTKIEDAHPRFMMPGIGYVRAIETEDGRRIDLRETL